MAGPLSRGPAGFTAWLQGEHHADLAGIVAGATEWAGQVFKTQ